MTALLNYLIVEDKCQSLKYIENALSLLQIPFSTCSIDEANNKEFIEKQQPTAIIGCDHHLDKLPSPTDSLPIIVVYKSASTLDRVTDTHITMLKTPFSIYSLKSALLAADTHQASTRKTPDDAVFKNLVGESEPIARIRHIIAQVANSDSNILILGESGTGKEIIASCIHQLSKRVNKPFVPINCGAIPAELMESELFGHEKGAFTGAVSKRAGRFELANEGTIFLDEIGDMPLHMQVKLLRVIQDRRIERVGSTSSIEINVRLVAATNRNLEDMIAKNEFREDLFYRLNVIPIHVPALCDRISDIPLLIQHQLAKIRKRIPHTAIFSDEAISALCQYNWPGNIRELSNFVERMVVLCQDEVISEEAVNEQLNSFKSMAKKKQNKGIHLMSPEDDDLPTKKKASSKN